MHVVMSLRNGLKLHVQSFVAYVMVGRDFIIHWHKNLKPKLFKYQFKVLCKIKIVICIIVSTFIILGKI